MTYLWMDIAFLALASMIAQIGRGQVALRASVFAGLALLLMTVVFDNAIIGAGIVAYDPDKILGVMLGLAPIEDFAYALAAILIVPAIWVALGRRSDRGGRGHGARGDVSDRGEE